MDQDRAWYVFRYYARLMSEQERMTERHLVATIKATHGHDDAEAQEKAKRGPRPFRAMLSSDPEVLSLASEGRTAFILRSAERIMRDHSQEVVFNCCPRCGRVARTPKAQQCRFCGHDWHARPLT